MNISQLSEKKYWENCWAKVRLPAIIEPTTKKATTKEILRIFQDILPQKKLAMIEIGGAPGQFAAYFSRFHGYKASIIEYTEAGCQKTRENAELLGLDIKVYNLDFFGGLSDIPRFDVVLSMGFIEHFTDLDDVFRRHIELLKKGGILILGVPNFRGTSQKILSKTAPKMLARHNLKAMDINNWNSIETVYGLSPLFKGYIGGFDPKILKRCEHRTPLNLSIRYFFKMLSCVFSILPFLRRYNSPKWSAYLLGIYKLDN